MAGSAAAKSRSLEYTPTWTVTIVCIVMIAMGLFLVFAIEKIEQWLKGSHRKPLVAAVERLKEELMLLGFVSLMLTVFQDSIASICLKESVMEHWTPCDRAAKKAETDSPYPFAEKNGRRLLVLDSWPMNVWNQEPLFHGRMLAEDSSGCREGYNSFVSKDGLHQLHILIFVLAAVHVVYSSTAMVLAALKVRSWRVWEEEAQRVTGEKKGDMIKQLTMERNQSFIQHHTETPLERSKLFVWMVCFFRQFGQSVTRSDYLSLRLGFIETHNTGYRFDFHKYMMRTLEDEFRVIVGINLVLWALVIVTLLLNISGTNLLFWLSLIPGVLILTVGTKLQHVIATLALENAGKASRKHYAAPRPDAALKPRDDLFWFKRPQLLLAIMHFILFENAFEMSTFVWYLWQFGIDSCMLTNGNLKFFFIRIGLGAVVQFLCSYSTLPLYAIVTQMGSNYKQAIFHPHVQAKIHTWRKDAKKRVKLRSLAISERGHSKSNRQGPMRRHDELTPNGSITSVWSDDYVYDSTSQETAEEDSSSSESGDDQTVITDSTSTSPSPPEKHLVPPARNLSYQNGEIEIYNPSSEFFHPSGEP